MIGTIQAICVSAARGTPKRPVPEAALRASWGIVGDAHAGTWHRQVSLLPLEEMNRMREKGAQISFGDFGENLVVEGLGDLSALPVGSRLRIGGAVLELTQLGKECHSHCAIFQQVGTCIMPRKGVFARVLAEGIIRVGDPIEVSPPPENRPFAAAVITLSDKGSAGLREDRSGPLACQLLSEAGFQVEETLLLPDERSKLEQQLIRLADQRQLDLILTTGGTGFAPRDVTPEATIAVCDRMASGIAEAIRAYSMTITPRAMLSRAQSGIRGKTLIVNLPGSPKAVREALTFLLPTLGHGLALLRGTDGECARP